MNPTSPEWLVIWIIIGARFIWWLYEGYSIHKHRRIEIDYRILQRK